MSKSIYLAGPISGMSYQESRYGWRKAISELVDPSIEILSPMRTESHLQEVTVELETTLAEYGNNMWTRGKTLVCKDRADVARADVVVMNLMGATRVSTGSMIELGWATEQRKPVVLLIEEDASKNPHNHLFVTTLADITVHSIEDAAHAVNGLLSSGV